MNRAWKCINGERSSPEIHTSKEWDIVSNSLPARRCTQASVDQWSYRATHLPAKISLVIRGVPSVSTPGISSVADPRDGSRGRSLGLRHTLPSTGSVLCAPRLASAIRHPRSVLTSLVIITFGHASVRMRLTAASKRSTHSFKRTCQYTSRLRGRRINDVVNHVQLP